MAPKEALQDVKKVIGGLPLPKKRKLQRHDIVSIVLSFIIALFLWVYIASSIMTDYSVSFSKIPVKVDLTGTRAESLELNLLPDSEEELEDLSVDCTIRGTRAALGALKRSDVEAYVDFDTTVADVIGKQSLPIRLRTINGADLPNVELSQKYAEVEMDHYQSVDIPVADVDYPFLVYDDETSIIREEITYEPATVKVTGPSARLRSLDHIKVTIPDSEELRQTKTFSELTDFSLIDKDGNAVNTSTLRIQTTHFSVRIPVYYSRKLPVSVKIINTPEKFDEEAILKRIRITANDTEYVLPGQGDNNLMIKIETKDPENKAKLDQREIWTIGSIPISSLSPGNPIKLPVTMEDGFTDSSNLGTVYISLDGTDLITETRWIKNSDIVPINPDSHYDYAMETPGGKTLITLIGTAEELSKIDTADLEATVNLINITVTTEGVYSQAFNVTLPDTVSGVWVSPTPTVNIVVSVADS